MGQGTCGKHALALTIEAFATGDSGSHELNKPTMAMAPKARALLVLYVGSRWISGFRILVTPPRASNH